MSLFASKLLRSIRPVSSLNQTLNIANTRTFCVSFPKLDEYKSQLTAKQINNDNPFDTYVLKPEAGKGLLKSEPILIPSMNESRYSYFMKSLRV